MSNPTINEYIPDNLIISGQMSYQTDNASVASGTYKRGTLMAYKSIDASNVVTIVPLNMAATDGTQTPYCILANDVDATDGATRCVIYCTGAFNSRAVILPAGVTVAQVYNSCAKINIYLNYAQPNE